MPKASAAESTPTTIPYDEFARNPAGILEQLTPGGEPVAGHRRAQRYALSGRRRTARSPRRPAAHQGRPALGACRLRDGRAAHGRRQEARVSGRALYPSAVSIPAVGSRRVFLDSSGFLALIHPRDAHYQEARTCWAWLSDHYWLPVTTNFIVAETHGRRNTRALAILPRPDPCDRPPASASPECHADRAGHGR